LHLVGILFSHINEDAGQNHIKYLLLLLLLILLLLLLTAIKLSLGGNSITLWQ